MVYARLKIAFRKDCGFKSHPRHQVLLIQVRPAAPSFIYKQLML